MLNKLPISTSLSCALLLSGCSSLDGELSFNNEIDGEWAMGCHYLADENRYLSTSIAISDNTFVETETISLDDACAMKRYTTRSTGTFKAYGSLTLNSGERVRTYTKDVDAVFFSPQSDDIATDYNNRLFCDHSNWQKSIEVDVSDCDTFSDYDHEHGIYKLDDNKVYFGDESSGDGSSQDNQPTQLSERFFSPS
jgi:hypothetical protein